MQLQGQPRGAEYLDDEIDVLFESDKDMQDLSLFRHLPNHLSYDNEKCEWQDSEMSPETLSVQASGDGADWDTVNDITALPVATAQITKLKVGDVLETDNGEHVIVSAIDESGQTIDLHKRGWGGTTAAVMAHDSAHTLKIIGNAQVDGSDPMDGAYHAPTERYNLTQIFEDMLEISGLVMRSRISRLSERARQVAEKLPRLISQLNNAMVNGSREKAGNRSTFQGIRNTGTTTYNVNGSLTKAKLYAAVIAMKSAGGHPSAIHGSATAIGIIEQLLSDNVTSSVSDWNAKLTVTKVNMMSTEIELHVDKHMIDTEFFVLDYGRISFGTLDSKEAKGAFALAVITNNLKQLKEQLAGYYTIKIKQPAACIVRAYGMTG